MREKHGTYTATIAFSTNNEAAGALVSLVPIERQNKTYKGTANESGQVEIQRVKPGNYDIHVNALKNPATCEKESHTGPSLNIKAGDQLHQSITLT